MTKQGLKRKSCQFGSMTLTTVPHWPGCIYVHKIAAVFLLWCFQFRIGLCERKVLGKSMAIALKQVYFPQGSWLRLYVALDYMRTSTLHMFISG